ncbi:MAG: hypothetical protein IJE79_00820 [Alphaproteobacteria bacterium]|nr:hypothetical protein [Alphaproteobacteria bacterium]
MKKEKCSKCQKEINGFRCKNCGAINWAAIRGTIIIVAVVLLFTQCEYTEAPDSQNTDNTVEVSETKKQQNELLSVKNNVVVKTFPACFSKDAHKEMVNFKVTGDQYGFTQLFDSGQCIFLNEGIRISVMDLHIYSATKIRAYGKDGGAFDLYTDYEYVME